MEYKQAEKYLPAELLAKIQEYVDGEYLYIPRRTDNHKAWGEKNGYKATLEERNQEIIRRKHNGESVQKLAEVYFLSEKSIYRILSQSWNYIR